MYPACLDMNLYSQPVYIFQDCYLNYDSFSFLKYEQVTCFFTAYKTKPFVLFERAT